MSSETPKRPQPLRAMILEVIALIVAVVALAGSFYLSLGMTLQACPLCLYERTFLIGVVVVLGLSWLQPAMWHSRSATLLALPLAVAGLAVAGFHVWLEVTGRLVCPYGLGNITTAPKQSLAAYGIICLALIASVMAFGRGWWRSAGLILLHSAIGLVFAALALVSGPEMPTATLTADEARAQRDQGQLDRCLPVLMRGNAG